MSRKIIGFALFFLVFIVLQRETQGQFENAKYKVPLLTKLFTDCYFGNILDSFKYQFVPKSGKCSSLTDAAGLECWPTTLVGQTKVVKCSGLVYKPGKGDSGRRKCGINGTWDDVDYSDCIKLSTDEVDHNLNNLSVIFGYTTWKEVNRIEDREDADDITKELKFGIRIFDAIVCFIAFVSLLYLIPLKKPRILIHRNLVLAFFCTDVVQAIMLADSMKEEYKTCSFLSVFSFYFILTQFCWMFNEGFYQFRRFYFVFYTKNYMWAYFIFGWIFPAITTFCIYLPVMLEHPPIKDFALCWDSFSSYEYNYIMYGQYLLLLVINISMVTYLMYVVWSKLRSTPDHELVKSRKAARGFIILLILLGGAYIFPFYGPGQYIPFKFVNAIVIPIQGTLVCIFHVFLSREVKNAAKKKKFRKMSTRLSRTDKSSHTDSMDFSAPTSRRSSLFQVLTRKHSGGSRRNSEIPGEANSAGKGDVEMTSHSQIFSAKLNEALHTIGEENTPELSTKSPENVKKPPPYQDSEVYHLQEPTIQSSAIKTNDDVIANGQQPAFDNPGYQDDTDSFDSVEIEIESKDTNETQQNDIQFDTVTGDEEFKPTDVPPQRIGVLGRPLSVQEYTYENIMNMSRNFSLPSQSGHLS